MQQNNNKLTIGEHMQEIKNFLKWKLFCSRRNRCTIVWNNKKEISEIKFNKNMQWRNIK